MVAEFYYEMAEKKKLNIETFNELLMKAIPKEKQEELLKIELQTAYGMKIEAMEELVKRLNSHSPYHDVLQKVNNIDSSCNRLAEIIDKWRAENDGIRSD